MMTLSEELLDIADKLDPLSEKGTQPEISGALNRLESAANSVSKAWSGSALGYHAYVYYEGLQPPPPGAHFSQEWGFKQLYSMPTTTGDWQEFDPEGVK